MIFLLGSCAFLKKGSSSSNAYAGYQEDISENRITFPDPSTLTPDDESTKASGSLEISEDLNIALDRMAESNKSERYWGGFTVLVYSGVDRDQAFKTRNDLFTDFPDIKAEMQYQQPRYLVKVGKYVNRIEAQSHYHKLKDQFPAARIIQDRFQREGYVNSEPIPDSEKQNQDPRQKL